MSHKISVSVASLQPSQFEGWATKQGGGWKSWKRRWFVIKDRKMWYFVGKNDTEAKGWIDLTPGTEVRDLTEPGQKKKFSFSIKSRGVKGEREFPIFVESETDLKGFLKAINQVLQGDKKQANQPKLNNFAPPNVNGDPAPAEKPKEEPKPAAAPAQPSPAMPPPKPFAETTENAFSSAQGGQNAFTQTRPGFDGGFYSSQPTASASLTIPASVAKQPVVQQIQVATDMCNWLKSNNPEGVLDFLGIWKDSLPVNADMEMGEIANVNLVVSANAHKLSWRIDGPQGALIQKMVDFFWNVGAPEVEIDRLNDLGADINPLFIGSWIDMSEEGGMDGGWFFPVDVDLAVGKNAGDGQSPQDSVTKLVDFAQKNGLNTIVSIGRDMGATPPRQTDFKFKLVGPNSAKLNIVRDACNTFGFPNIPQALESAIDTYTGNEILMSVVTSTDGFVKFAVIIPNPDALAISKLIESIPQNDIPKHQQYLNTFGQPVAVEYSFLNKGFGFDVYKEGADVHVHYPLGGVTA